MAVEVYFCPEMYVAGVEAMREAREANLSEADIVREVYLAMYGAGIKATCEGEAPIN